MSTQTSGFPGRVTGYRPPRAPAPPPPPPRPSQELLPPAPVPVPRSAAERVVRAITSPATLWAIVGAGIALRAIAYLFGASQWSDEAALSYSVLERSLGGLLAEPLDFGRVAPKGFLVLQKLAVAALGPHDLALRLVPFLAGAASVVLFRSVAARVLRGVGVPVALLLFVIGHPFVAWSAQARPYSLDLALSLWLFRLTLDVRARRGGLTPRRAIRLAAVGAVAVWFSHAALLTVAALGVGIAALAWSARRRRGTPVPRALFPLAALWGASVAAAAWLAVHSLSPATVEYLRLFHGREGFVPLPPRDAADALWPWHATVRALRWLVPGRTEALWQALYPAVALLGVVAMWGRRRGTAVLITLSLLAPVAAAAAGWYPVVDRLVLFQLALLMLALGEAAQRATRVCHGPMAPTGWAVVAAFCVMPFVSLATQPPPYPGQLVGPALSYVRASWEPGDVVYVGNDAALSFLYYAPRLGFGTGDYLLSPCPALNDQPAVRRFLRDDLDRLRGRRRVWVYLGPEAGAERSRLQLDYLSAIGVVRDSLQPAHRGGARRADGTGRTTVYLFDLGDSTRLARHSADSYPVSPRRLEKREGWWCYGVFQPLLRESSGDPPPVWYRKRG